MNKKNNLTAKIFSTIIALITTIKFVLLRRALPFDKLLRNKVPKKNSSNYSSYLVIRATGFIFKALRIKSCFTKSLVIQEMLNSCGIENTIEIGVKESEAKINSHCWVRTKNFYTESEQIRNKYKVLEVE